MLPLPLANISNTLFNRMSPVHREAWFPGGDNNIRTLRLCSPRVVWALHTYPTHSLNPAKFVISAVIFYWCFVLPARYWVWPVGRAEILIRYTHSWGIHGAFPKFSLGVFLRHSLRYSQDIPKVFPRYSEGIPKVFQRYFQGVAKVFPRYSQGIPKVFPRHSQGIFKVFPRYSQGFQKVFPLFFVNSNIFLFIFAFFVNPNIFIILYVFSMGTKCICICIQEEKIIQMYKF